MGNFQSDRFLVLATEEASPTLTGRIEFLIVRMDRSPPVAPHPVSRRRSYSWLQAGERIPEEDFHLSDHTRFQAHVAGAAGPGKRPASTRQATVGTENLSFEAHCYSYPFLTNTMTQS